MEGRNMRSRKRALFSLAVVAILALALCISPVGAVEKKFISIASGWVAGAYYPIAGVIAKIAYTKLKDKGIKITAESSGASVANAKLLDAGESDMAILQNDIASYAVQGTKPLFDAPIKNLRGVACLFPEYVQCVARKASNINSIADLKGKKVCTGPVGSGTSENAKQILEAWGLKREDVKIEQLEATQASDYIKDGRLDAAFYTVGMGAAVIADTTLLVDCNIVPIDGANADALMKKYPFFAKQVIPGKTYKGSDADINTVAVMAMLAARADLEDSIVYDILKATMDDVKEVHRAHDRYKSFTPQTALVGMSIPLHNGAEKYYKEIGLLK
jgi:uncharacterized protein